MLKVALVGCGKIADAHAEQLRRIKGCEIAGVCDREPLMARQLADRFPVGRCFSDVDHLLNEVRPDVVHITTPPQGHFDIARRCLEAGSHVYVEKPFTLDEAEAQELIALAVGRRLKIIAGHDDQFSHVARRMRSLVQSGYLGGPPVHMESHYSYELGGSYVAALMGDKQHWVRRLPGKLLHNIISHGIARIAEFLTSDSPHVIAHGFTSSFLRKMGETEIVDELRVIISEDSGATAYFTFSSQIRPAIHQFRIFGPKNGLFLDQDEDALIKLRGARYTSYLQKFVPPLTNAQQQLGNLNTNVRTFLGRDFHMKSGMKFLIESFYESIREDRPEPISHREILLTARIMDAIFGQIWNTQPTRSLAGLDPVWVELDPTENPMIDVAIIGAGPYGLSIAAHLKPQGVDFRIFGPPMDTWLNHMPKGMKLKSEGFASSMYDPESQLPLGNYCQERKIPYADLGLPVPLATFCDYGLEFQQRFVPNVENKLVTSLRRDQSAFTICLDTGETVTAKRVVIAAGLGYFKYVPPPLSVLPEELATHSWTHSTLDRFKGREIAVVGAGASALDLAALLHKAGAAVHVIARKPEIRFQSAMLLPRPFSERFRYPLTGIGSGWRMVFYTRAPLAFRKLPEWIRLEAVRRTLGPAPCWFTKEEVVGKVSFYRGVNISKAETKNNKVRLELTDGAGVRQEVVSDHVIAATGYNVDVRQITIFNPDMLAKIASVQQTPVLSSNFESSVPGLFFVGIPAANTFGPLLRFAVGAGFAARRLSKHLARSASRGLVQGGVGLVSAPR